MTLVLPSLSASKGGSPTTPFLSASPLLYAPRLSRTSLASVAIVHSGLLAYLMLFVIDTPERITPPRPITVSLVEAERPDPQPQPKPMPPRPVVRPLPRPSILVAKRAPPTMQPMVEAPTPAPQPARVPSPAPMATEAAQLAPLPPTPPHPADYLSNPKPPYPALSRRLGEEGVVRLRALINADGSVAQVELLKSSGHERLDHSALNTVKHSWQFEPARQNGQPVADWVNFPIEFTLNRS